MTSILKGPHQIHWVCFHTNAIGWAKPKQEIIPLILSCCHRQADVTLYKFKAFRGWGMPEPSSQTRVTTLNWKPSYRAALSSGELTPNIFQKQEQIHVSGLLRRPQRAHSHEAISLAEGIYLHLTCTHKSQTPWEAIEHTHSYVSNLKCFFSWFANKKF